MRKRNPIVRADTEEGQLGGEIVVEAIENQIRENDPPEVKQALKRLMAMGESRNNAIRYIGCAFSVEMFEILQNQAEYDHARYIKNLKALPTLPFDDEEEI